MGMKRFAYTLKASVITLILFLPSLTHAQVEPISRGEFMQLVVQEFNLPLKAEQFIAKDQYTRVPNHLLPTVDALASKQALGVFGSTIAPARTITKGEAVRIVVALQNAKTSRVYTFRDVSRSTINQQAVSAAVERGWITPVSERYFGFSEQLSANAARLFVGKVTGRYSPTDTSVESPAQVPMNDTPLTIQVPIVRRSNVELPNQALIETVWKLLEDDYLYHTKLDENEAAWSIAESITQSLDDPYTSFMRPQSTSDFFTSINGEVVGIGAQVQESNKLVEVVSPLPGSPAERAGVLPGDIILEVNEEDITQLPFMEAVNKIRGERGSIARLTILRNYSEITLFVERDLVRVSDYEVTWQGNVAVVRILQFGQSTNTKLQAELSRINDRNPSGIILDLRNNPGGLLDAAGHVVSAFVPRKSTFAHIVAKNSTTPSFTYDDPVVDGDVPLMVLINGGSASASEITAGALQDLDRATIIGTTSFGKGTVQQIHQFNDGSSLKLTIAEWLTPNKRKIDQVGIDPDFTVEDSVDRDAPLLKALQLLP